MPLTKRVRCPYAECEFHAETQEELDEHVKYNFHCPKCSSPLGQNFVAKNSFRLCSWCWSAAVDGTREKLGMVGRVDA